MDVKNSVVRGRKRKCMERRREILTVIQAAHTRDPINLTQHFVYETVVRSSEAYSASDDHFHSFFFSSFRGQNLSFLV